MDRKAGDCKGQARYLLAQLTEGSEYLENQREALSRLWEGFEGKIATFYELNPTDPAKKVDTTPTALHYVHIMRVLCFFSFVREDSRLTLIVGTRITRTGRKGSPSGATIVGAALFTWGISPSGRL